jgi:signal transduction histidine kinase
MIGNRVFALKGDVNEMGHELQSEGPDVESLRSLHASIATNIHRIDEILQDFRDFVTATQLDRDVQSVNSLVEETVREVFPQRTDVELLLELGEGLPDLAIDGKKLRRAISELIENSMNWVEKGRLRVATGWAAEADLRRARLPESRKYVKIEVEDSGPGVEPDKKEEIFQPFMSGRVKGMGLGLSIVRGIANAHGGAAIESGELGKGARFVILLPVPERPKSEGI